MKTCKYISPTQPLMGIIIVWAYSHSENNFSIKAHTESSFKSQTVLSLFNTQITSKPFAKLLQDVQAHDCRFRRLGCGCCPILLIRSVSLLRSVSLWRLPICCQVCLQRGSRWCFPNLPIRSLLLNPEPHPETLNPTSFIS